MRMSSTTQDGGPALGSPPSTAISRSVKTLLAFHDLTVPDLEERIGLPKSNVYRRYKEGGWLADEVWVIAAFFGLPIEQLYSGHPDLAGSRLSSEPLRFSRQHEDAGQAPFSGADIDEFLTAIEVPLSSKRNIA